MSSSAAGALARTVRVLHRCEDGLLAVLLGAMVLLAPAQILLRNFFDASLSWGDPLLRMLVLWVGLLGALAATRGDRQICVDALSRVLPPRARLAARVVTQLFASSVAGLVAWVALRLVLSEFAYGSSAFAGVPAWLCQAVIPFAFGGIALRQLAQLRIDLRGASAPGTDGP